MSEEGTRRCVVQFMHPGGESRPGRDGHCRWDSARLTHSRKFLTLPGRFTADSHGPPTASELHFWAEWEAQADGRAIDKPVPEGPRFLFRPYAEPATRFWRPDTPAQNTDPFVFGDNFFYTGCKQWRGHGSRRGPTQLRDLARGSLVLFGSKLNGRFVLDTAFVVSGSALHTMSDWQESVGGSVPAVYRETTLVPWYGWKEHGPFRLHKAASIDEPLDGMFSFFPTLPADSGDGRGFARPTIELPGIVNPNLMMHSKLTRDPAPSEVRRLWEQVAEQVLDQGLCLGVSASLPELR
jgi:hypothetical protein